MAAFFENILETIGRTPVVKIGKLAPPGVELFVKLEAFNPLGSVKDRLALGVIEAAERSGELKPGQTVIEATSGNTGIGLAMVCAQKGYPLVVTMAENFSVERRKLMRFLGAKVVLTPASEKGSGMLAKAAELAQTHGWFLCRQFENEANPDFHSRTTAVEILEAFEADRLDYWVTGMGTGGTLKGVARVLKKQKAGDQDRCLRAGQFPASGQRHSPGTRRRRCTHGKPSALPPASHAGLDAGLHSQACRRRRQGRIDRRGRCRSRALTPCASRANSRRRKGSSPVSPAAPPSPARCRSARAQRRARRFYACCPTPANAI